MSDVQSQGYEARHSCKVVKVFKRFFSRLSPSVFLASAVFGCGKSKHEKKLVRARDLSIYISSDKNEKSEYIFIKGVNLGVRRVYFFSSFKCRA